MKINKKIQTITVLTLLATTLLAGCSNTTSSDTSKNNEASTENVTATEEVEATPSATIDPQLHADNLMGIYIGENQSQIGLGITTEDTETILGKADNVEKSGKKISWYYEALDVTITFQKENKIATISSIEGGKNATTFLTGGGITAGSSRKDIVTAYKEQLGVDADTSKNKIVIDNMGYSRLVFTLKKDKVVSICMELSEI